MTNGEDRSHGHDVSIGSGAPILFDYADNWFSGYDPQRYLHGVNGANPEQRSQHTHNIVGSTVVPDTGDGMPYLQMTVCVQD